LTVRDEIEAVGAEDHVLGRHRHERRVRPRAGPGEVEHPGAEIDADDASLDANPVGQQVGDQAGSTPHVEDDFSADGRGDLDQPGGDPAVKA